MKRVLSAIIVSTAVVTAMCPAWAQETAAPTSSTPATTPAIARKAKVGVIHLSGALAERPESFSLSLSSLMSGGEQGPVLSNLIVRLNAAAKDTAISGVLLDLTSLSLTLNQSQEIGGLMTNLRKAGKRVVIYSADYDAATYALASYADTIIMPENGDVMVPGVGMQMIFFAGTLEKLHMSADFVQVGKFKGAQEPYTRTSASPEYKAQIEKLVDGMYDQLVGTIAANRPNLTQDQVKKLIDEAWFTGKHAKELGLVDQTIARDRVDKWFASQFPAGATMIDDYGEPKKESLDLSSPLAIFSLLGGSDKPRGSSAPAVAVLYATGEINGDSAGLSTGDTVTPATIRKAVQTALDDNKVRAIVLRVDSPGGSAAASDEIWAVLKEADKIKPVTVSMGRVAASGGYYISCAGRSIIADPATITGSIGVVGGKIVIKDALDWAGLKIEPVERGQHSEMMSSLRPFSDEEKAFIEKQMNEVYGVFKSRVATARGDKVANLEEVAAGRLFTGQQAKEAGLVDDVGTLNDAVKAAAKAAKIDGNYQMIVLPEPKTLADVLRESLAAGSPNSSAGPVVTASFKLDTPTALLSALPAEVRKPTLDALHLLQSMENNRVMLSMPPGLVETHGHHQ